MSIETLIIEYESEADVRGHVPRRLLITGECTSPRVMKQAADQCDRWRLPYAIFEVIEITDNDGEETRRSSRGNLDECLANVEKALLAKWEQALGLRLGSIRPFPVSDSQQPKD